MILLTANLGAAQSQKRALMDPNAPAAIESLVETEHAFARMVGAQGIRAAFLTFISEDCVLFHPDPVNGKAYWTERPDSPGLLSWEPVYADISQSGDLGYTTGPYEFRPKGRDDRPSSFGYYMSIWRKQANGSWQLVIDQGIPTAAHRTWPAKVSFPKDDQRGAFGKWRELDPGKGRDELLRMEQTLAQDAFNNSVQGFIKHADERIRLMRADKFPAIGKAAMRKELETTPCAPSWSPIFASASHSADLGYVYGTYHCGPTQNVERPADPERGAYVRIWKKLSGGEWRIVLDLLSAYGGQGPQTAKQENANSGPEVQRKSCPAADGVHIAYSVAGSGTTALIFIHGGLAGRYRVVALDLAGHGESGSNRKRWGLQAFGTDVKAVADAENLNHVVLFGNSLGGPAAIEAALLLPGRVLGVVGIDTFQNLDSAIAPEDAHQQAKAFLEDYAGNLKTMVKTLFHADASPALIASTEERMMKTTPAVAYAMFMGLAGYNPAASARKLTVPLRAINGDLFATDVQAIRKVKPDFDVVIMQHTGHYPMIERPEEFNRHVAGVVEELLKR